MTMISRFYVHNIPILIGDLLATVDSDPADEPEVSIPLSDEINHALKQRGADFAVKCLKQKINIINKHIIVGVAGNGAQAEKLLKVLSTLNPEEVSSISHINNFINHIDKSDRDELSAIGIVYRPGEGGQDGVFLPFEYNASVRHGAEFGEICVAGTGADAMLDWLQKLRPYVHSVSGIKGVIAKAFGVGLSTLLAGVDAMYGDNILNRWGGGFEALTYDIERKEFTKAGDIVHLFFYATKDSNSGWVLLQRQNIMRQFYIQDILYQHIFNYSNTSNGQITTGRNELLCALPVLEDNASPPDDLIRSLNEYTWKYLCCHVRVFDGSQHHHTQRLFSKESGFDRFVFKNEGGDDFFMAIHTSIINTLLQDAAACCDSPAPISFG